MKYTMQIAAMLLFLKAGLAQSTTNISISQDFANTANTHALATGTSAYQTYTSDHVDGSQFFLPDWKKGEIIANNNSIYDMGYVFAYDKVRQEVFIKQKDSTVIIEGNKADIRCFSLLDDGKVYLFSNSSVYTKESPEVFYQVLVADSTKLTFLKYTSTKLVKADKNDMMKQKEGEVYDAFVDSYTYYIVKGKGDLKPIQLKTKSVKKIFEELNIPADKYLSAHPGSVNEEYLTTMVTELNR
jgi:hypothetical protein